MVTHPTEPPSPGFHKMKREDESLSHFERFRRRSRRSQMSRLSKNRWPIIPFQLIHNSSEFVNESMNKIAGWNLVCQNFSLPKFEFGGVWIQLVRYSAKLVYDLKPSMSSLPQSQNIPRLTEPYQT